ncbi:MAG TPA: hypothetical protein VJ927_04980 [Actinomycetota bacterium]|nr:hypothetical protein [Actinomycetota bacterium]
MSESMAAMLTGVTLISTGVALIATCVAIAAARSAVTNARKLRVVSGRGPRPALVSLRPRPRARREPVAS